MKNAIKAKIYTWKVFELQLLQAFCLSFISFTENKKLKNIEFILKTAEGLETFLPII